MLILLGGVRVGGAEGGHFDGLRTQHHVHQAKAPPDDEGTAKERLYLLRPGVGRDVEILRLDAQEEIPHRTADDVGRESRLPQDRANLGGGGRDRIARKPVLFARHAIRVVGRQPENAPDEPLDHSRAGILPEGHRGPSAPVRFGREGGIRIDGDRAGDALEERQVVV